MIDLRQAELMAWQERNFGSDSTAKPEWCALGMAEEVGELCHVLLKHKQGIREPGNMTCEECQRELADAIADVFIYGIQLCSTLGIDAEKALEETLAKVLRRVWK